MNFKNMSKKPVVLICFTLLLTFTLYYGDIYSSNTNTGRRLQEIEIEETTLLGPEITEATCEGKDQSALVTDKERETADDYVAKTSASFDGNPILNYMTDGDIEALGMAIAPVYIAPWLALTILTLLFSFAYCVCSSNCCPWFLCKKRDPEINPYEGMELAWPSGCSFLFLLGAFCSCLAGLVTASSIEEAFGTSMCGFQVTLNNLNAGIEGSWTGFNGIADRVTALADNIGTLEDGVSIFSDDKPWLDVVEQNMLDDITDISDAAVAGSNAFTTDSAGNSYTLDSFFMTYWFAPEDQDGSWLNIVKLIVEVSVSGFVEAMASLQETGSSMNDGIASMASAMADASTSLDGLRESVDDLQISLDDQAELGGMALGFVTLALQILFGIGLVVCILGLLGVIFAFVLKKHGCSFLFCLAWLIMVPICILCFIILMITMPLSVASFQLCDLMHNCLNDYEYFSANGGALAVDQEFVDFISKCRTNLGGDGDILEQAGIGEDLDAIAEIDEQIGALEEFQSGDTGDALSSLGDLIDDMNFAIGTAFGTGGYIQTVDGEFNEFQEADDAVADDFASWGEACSDDNTFAWYESGCNSGYTYSDASSSFSASASGNCYLFGELSQSDFDDYADSCGTSIATMKTEFGYVLAFIAECNTMALQITDVSSVNLVDNLKDSFNDYDGETGAFMTDINDFAAECSSVIDLVINPETGLVSDINCLGVGDSMDNIYDVLCVAFIPALFETSVIIACASCFMFCSMFFLFFASIRFKKAAPSGGTNKQVGQE